MDQIAFSFPLRRHTPTIQQGGTQPVVPVFVAVANNISSGCPMVACITFTHATTDRRSTAVLIAVLRPLHVLPTQLGVQWRQPGDAYPLLCCI